MTFKPLKNTTYYCSATCDGSPFLLIAFDSGKNESYRQIICSNSTTLTVNGGYYNGTADNDACIPITVYGFKKDIDLNAIVANVTTSADKCMMSDGVTSVEDKFTLQTSQATADSGYTLVVNQIRKRTGMCEVLLTLSNFTNAGGSWVKFATVPIKPIDQDCIGTAFNGNTANFLGEARIDPSGNVYVLPQYSVSGIYVTMRFMYFTND